MEFDFRIAQPYEGPDGHNHSRAEGKLLGREQSSNMCEIELLEVPLDGSRSICALSPAVPKNVTGFQVLDSQRRCLAVDSGHLMHDPYGFVVMSLAHVEFRRLVDGEQNESNEKHHHGNASHRDHEVSPAHVLGSCADFALLTSQIPKDRPGNERGQKLRQRPVDRENCEEVLVTTGEEFQEDGRVDREVAADSK